MLPRVGRLENEAEGDVEPERKRDDVLTGRTAGMMEEGNTSMQETRGVSSG